jgi:phospholipase/carboxylesterase
MHGYGSNEFDLLEGLSEILDGQILSLRAPYNTPYGGFCWSYLPPKFDREMYSKPLEQLPDYVEKMVDQTEVAVDSVITLIQDLVGEAKIIPIGFSQGGLMVSELLRHIPEKIDKAVMLSGLINPIPHKNDELLKQHNIKTFVGYGDSDNVLPQEYLQALAQFINENTESEQHIYEGMVHTINEIEYCHLNKFLS